MSAAPRPEIGCFEVELMPEGEAEPVMGALPRRFEAFERHSYAFDVPPNGVLRASTRSAPRRSRSERRGV